MLPSKTPAGSMRSPALRFASMGLELMATIVGGLLLGFGLDWLLRTGPWLAIVGVAFGAFAGMYNFIRTAAAESRKTNEQYRREHPHPPGRSDHRGQADPDA